MSFDMTAFFSLLSISIAGNRTIWVNINIIRDEMGNNFILCAVRIAHCVYILNHVQTEVIVITYPNRGAAGGSRVR